MIGKAISHYKILEKLGGGGMGVVYKAEDTKLKREVAMKFLPCEISAQSEERERFKIEARAAAALNHPNIAHIYAIEEVDDETFIVMEYIDGQELRDKIQKGPLEVNETLEISIQIAEGLKAAHEKGVVHRDIKSTNIMLTEKGQVKIMDFGLAKIEDARITKTGTTMGTAAYLSPEQANCDPVDHRTDIWSLGVVLYEMLTGKLPFKGDVEQAVIYSILTKEPEPITGVRAGIPMILEQIIGKALAKNPDERFQHSDEMLDHLRRLGKSDESWRIKSKPFKVRHPRIKHPLLYGFVAAVLITLVLASLYLFTGRTEGIDSIAVLPLANLSGDPEEEYFADGMTEALINELSKIGALKVISRTSVMQYKEAKKSLPEIARDLCVNAVAP